MKKALASLLITIASGLFIVILLVIIMDPLFHYHKPLNDKGIYLYNEMYQAPGMARNFSFDTAMLGSSMTENFMVSWFEEYGEKAVKLSYSGARSKDIERLLEEIFESENSVKRIYIDINDYQLSESPDSVYSEPPLYLYDNNLMNDAQYIFNKDVVIASFLSIFSKEGNLDEAFTWTDEDLFGEDKVLEDLKGQDSNRAWVSSEDGYIKGNAEANIANLAHYFNEHKETEFIIFYPPYSEAYWYDLNERNVLSKKLLMYNESIESLLGYDNVKIYFFMDAYDIIADLNSYRDMCHFNQSVNYYMLSEMHDPLSVYLINDKRAADERLLNLNEFAKNIKIVVDN